MGMKEITKRMKKIAISIFGFIGFIQSFLP